MGNYTELCKYWYTKSCKECGTSFTGCWYLIEECANIPDQCIQQECGVFKMKEEVYSVQEPIRTSIAPS